MAAGSAPKQLAQRALAAVQSILGLLALGDVSREAFDAHEPPRAVKLALCRLLQPDLTTVRADEFEHQRVGSIVRVQASYVLLEALTIMGVNLLQENSCAR